LIPPSLPSGKLLVNDRGAPCPGDPNLLMAGDPIQVYNIEGEVQQHVGVNGFSE
jgi:hypothetical protein